MLYVSMISYLDSFLSLHGHTKLAHYSLSSSIEMARVVKKCISLTDIPHAEMVASSSG